MNKTVVAVAVGAVLLVAVGGGWYLTTNKSKGTEGTVAKTEGGGAFGSIKDALAKSLSLKCEFSDEGGRKTTAYLKAGAVRADTVGKTAEETGSVIVKDKKMYFWNGKEGMMIELKDEEGSDGTASGLQGGNVLQDLEKYKNSCTAAVVADSLFVPPTDVKFGDFSQLQNLIPKSE